MAVELATARAQRDALVLELEHERSQATLLSSAGRTIRQSEQMVRRLSAIVESSSEAIIGLGLDGTIVSWNLGAEKLYGYAAAEVTGRSTEILTPNRAVERERVDMGRRLIGGDSVVGLETTRIRKDGTVIDVSLTASPIYEDDGSMVGFSAIVRDESARKRAERALTHQALHDTLTGLPNRALLEDRLRQALDRTRRGDCHVAVMFLDLDDFKLVNDGLGHLAGDAILVQAATRIRETLRPEDTVARFGGDEFVIICEVGTIDAALDVSGRLLAAVGAPYVLRGEAGNHDLSVTASVGLVMAGDEATPEELLQDADTAMYCAKGRGRSRVELFDSAMRQHAAARLSTSTALRRALARDELRVFYQPIVSVGSTRPLAVEALVRWEHPERGLVPPDEFIPLAEESGLIVPIGRWVLREALRERASWQAAMPLDPPLRLAVNLSALQLSDPSLVDDVAAALKEFGASPDSLILEITETVLMSDVDAPRTLRALRDMGVSLHIDDFGTGYSSLAYIRELPIDTLKIDRGFIDGLGSVDEHGYLVSAVISLASALSLEVIAEGVETELQLNVLRDMKCDNAQGFLFARPMPYVDLVSWLCRLR